jgi:hypothetical protein
MPETTEVQATRVETIRQGLRNQGFSAEKPDRIARRTRRESTMAIYNTKWNKLPEWCRNIQEDLAKPLHSWWHPS